MRRKMELARDILLAVEQSETEDFASIHLPTHATDAQLSLHVRLLHEAGLIEAVKAQRGDGVHWEPRALTWAGYDLLDLIRSDAVWAMIRQAAARAGGFNSEIIKEIGLREARKHIPREFSGAHEGLHYAAG